MSERLAARTCLPNIIVFVLSLSVNGEETVFLAH